MSVVSQDENLAYHATRLLILIRWCGKPRRSTADKLPGVVGRTLLAKTDFFLRYPFYLNQAISIRKENDAKLRKDISYENLGVSSFEELVTVESQMVRYLYGPWDYVYYPVLAYMIGKGLVKIEKGTRNVEIFRLTAKGLEITELLGREQAFQDLIVRADVVYYLFNKFTGSRLKDFIYNYFPEVVNRKIGKGI